MLQLVEPNRLPGLEVKATEAKIREWTLSRMWASSEDHGWRKHTATWTIETVEWAEEDRQ
eukprot:CAMPEP_0172789560 /NCGR_PEP_ID=MMETSP1074-20121228/207518_1 /TAXON_ID=2916 /ORGANISM="Ceratium fusus, Strain PA161109" /LENGTH=59 /DNA_ID=CAMNT_0013626599 /DNA_START=170 /DNA_END=352 /DNA_ORIENTATION=+